LNTRPYITLLPTNIDLCGSCNIGKMRDILRFQIYVEKTGLSDHPKSHPYSLSSSISNNNGRGGLTPVLLNQPEPKEGLIHI
jgi:hypothetical protein